MQPKVCAHAVEFVDIGQARDFVRVGRKLTFSDWTSTPPNCGQDDDCAVENTQRAFHFGSEIDVAGRVDQGDLRIAPFDGDGSRVNRNTFGFFEWVEVRGGIACIACSPTLCLEPL
jgi:hypothetical protein